MDGGLEGFQVVGLVEVYDLEVELFAVAFDPTVGLALGVDHQGPLGSLFGHDGVVNGDRVVRESLHNPVPDLDGGFDIIR